MTFINMNRSTLRLEEEIPCFKCLSDDSCKAGRGFLSQAALPTVAGPEL